MLPGSLEGTVGIALAFVSNHTTCAKVSVPLRDIKMVLIVVEVAHERDTTPDGAALRCGWCVDRCSGCYWSAGDWGSCSADCGNGSAQRMVQCLHDGLAVSPDHPGCSNGCQPALKPHVRVLSHVCMPELSVGESSHSFDLVCCTHEV